MCLILVAWQFLPEFPLVVAANRDEYHSRPSAAAGPWPEDPRVVGGRDLEAGGSWLGTRGGERFAAVTNIREPGAAKGRVSRGLLVRDFLLGEQEPGPCAAALDGTAHAGFNLLLGDRHELCYRSNRNGGARVLQPGIYGLSNHLLDTPWPKLLVARSRFRDALSELPALEPFFAILAETGIAPDRDLPATGLVLEWERALSAIFVRTPTYGTRASTVLIWPRSGGYQLEERQFDRNGLLQGTARLGSKPG
jgi:uncharacterized protein with NRDE domain